jgi:hypothetical protein
MVSPDSHATACLRSGRNSTYRPVQISEASSQIEIEIANTRRAKGATSRNLIASKHSAGNLSECTTQ